jgi:hypothetical protein
LLRIIETDLDALLTEYRETERLVDAGDPAAAQLHSINKVAPIYRELGTASIEFINVYKGLLDRDKKAVDDQYSSSLRIAIGMSCLSMLKSLLLGAGGEAQSCRNRTLSAHRDRLWSLVTTGGQF